MGTLDEDLSAIKEVEDKIVKNKVARFAYTDKAYTSNEANGVAEYNVNNDQNIPTADASVLKVNETVLSKGYRAQASSVTRMLLNHFFGRMSYNLNKVNDIVSNLIATLIGHRGTANGFATLDENGKVPYSQLPESAMEYKGQWNAKTNTPTLADGTGAKGDFYIVSVAGTQNLGSGDIQFFVNDRIIYDGSVWSRLSAGDVKTVNSVLPTNGNVALTGENIPVSSTNATLLSAPLTTDRYADSSVTNAKIKEPISVAKGGTGKTTENDAANTFINSLTTGESAPEDNDYFISQYVNGGTTTTTYHRRPISKLWEYIKNKISSALGLTASDYSGRAHIATNADYSKNMYSQTLDLSELDKTKFYPLFCASETNFAEVAINSASTASSSKYNQNRIHFDISTMGWSDTPFTLNIREYACHDNNEITIGCIGRGEHGGAWAIWLRGGIRYTCFSRDADLSLKTSDYTYGDETYTVGTNYYGGANTNVKIEFTPQSTITQGSYSSRPIAAPGIKATINFIGDLVGNVTGNSETATRTNCWEVKDADFVGDLNDLEIGRWYSVNTSDNAILNAPSRNNGWFSVLTFAANNNSWFKQQLGIYTNNNLMYTRTCHNNKWGNWERLAKASDVPPANMVHTCYTASATAAKTVSIPGFTLTQGACIRVLFGNGNSVAYPTLNVNDTGAKEICCAHGQLEVPVNKDSDLSNKIGGGVYTWDGVSRTVLDLYYDGVNWIVIGDPIVRRLYNGSTNSSKNVAITGGVTSSFLA